jgi:hypothetical protein
VGKDVPLVKPELEYAVTVPDALHTRRSPGFVATVHDTVPAFCGLVAEQYVPGRTTPATLRSTISLPLVDE